MSKITFDDYVELQNLVTRYCITTDNKDAEGFMDCWVAPEDFGGYHSGPFGDMRSWQELYDFEKHHVGPGGMANGKRHQATNVHIEVVNEKEVLITHDMLVIDVENEPAIIATGRYDKSVAVKTSKGWKYKKRTLEVDPGYFKLFEKWKAAGLVAEGAH